MRAAVDDAVAVAVAAFDGHVEREGEIDGKVCEVKRHVHTRRRRRRRRRRW
jgi:hypothetical protein